MQERMNRRQCLRAMGISGLAAGLGLAMRPGKSRGFQSSVIQSHKVETNSDAAILEGGKVIQPRRELPILHQTDVLVVGGGPAGVAAAIAARRTGADVTLVERYGHFGGLWTGGLVLLIIGHIVKGGKQVCQGIGEEFMRRLEKLDRGIINRRPGADPTVDAEAAKYMMVQMIEEAKVDVFLHCWGVDAIMDGNTVRGAVFESKSGRQAILAKTVVDATGDGDLFAAAGAEFEHRSHNVGLVSRIGNLDKVTAGEEIRTSAGAASDDAMQASTIEDPNRTALGQHPKPRRLGGMTPIKGVNWVNLTGPEVDGLDIRTLTKMEMNHRKFIWKSVQKIRKTPGYDKTYLLETAPQLGVRITRILHGTNCIRLSDLKAQTEFKDVVGVGGATGQAHGPWQIPYGALLPTKIDNILASGRCVSTEINMADLVRLIPNCFVTGHAAGVAAAVAAMDGCRPRNVNIAKVQDILKKQEAYLG